MNPRSMLLFMLSLWLTACSGDDFIGRRPADGFFNPTEIRFGERATGQLHREPVTLTNASGEPLNLAQARFDPPVSVFALRDANDNLVQNTLPSGSSIQLNVLFGPDEEREYSASLIVGTDRFSVELALSGTGRLLLSDFVGPESVNFLESVEVGRTLIQTVQLTNQGEAPGIITAGSVPAPFILLDEQDQPFTQSTEIAAGGRLTLRIGFAPTTAGTFDETITLNEAAGDTLSLRVQATSVPAGQMTCDRTSIAFGDVPRGETQSVTVQCTVTGGPYRVETARWTGSDDAGVSVTNVSPPLGNTIDGAFQFEVVFAPRGLAQRVPFTGTVVLQAAHGDTVSFDVSGRTIPPPRENLELVVQTTWTASVDLDLHLVRDGGGLFSSQDDCHFLAKTIDWNNPGDDTDDPFLDQDATNGPGEETASIQFARDGVYEVHVQYYEPRAGSVTADPTVTIQVPGQTFGPFNRPLSQCGTMWYVGRVRFDQGSPTFEPTGEESDRFRNRAECP